MRPRDVSAAERLVHRHRERSEGALEGDADFDLGLFQYASIGDRAWVDVDDAANGGALAANDLTINAVTMLS